MFVLHRSWGLLVRINSPQARHWRAYLVYCLFLPSTLPPVYHAVSQRRHHMLWTCCSASPHSKTQFHQGYGLKSPKLRTKIKSQVKFHKKAGSLQAQQSQQTSLSASQNMCLFREDMFSTSISCSLSYLERICKSPLTFLFTVALNLKLSKD